MTKAVSEDGHVVPMKSDYRCKHCTSASNDINDNNPNMLSQLDCCFTTAEKKTALRKLSLAFVMANIPDNMVENPWSKNFIWLVVHRPVSFCKRRLRPFCAQSAVGRFLSETESVFLAVDGWEDAQHLPVNHRTSAWKKRRLIDDQFYNAGAVGSWTLGRHAAE